MSAAAAVIAGFVTAGVVGRAEQTIAGYGTRRTVAVARSDLPVGATIADDDVAWQDVPAALTHGSPVDDPVGRTVVHPVLAGEPLVGERLAPDGLTPTEAIIGDHRRGLSITVAEDPGPLAPGTRVDLLAAGTAASTRASWVARDATVVAVADSTVIVAVDEDDAPEAARAALEGSIVIALVGAG